MRETQLQELADHAARFHWGQAVPEHRLSAVRAVAPPGGRVLEVGSGPGAQNSRALMAAGLRVTAADLVVDFLRATRAGAAGNRPALVACRADALPFRDGSFDVVCAFDVAEHLDQDEAAVREWARVAGSAVVLSVPSSEDAGLSKGGVTFAHWQDRTHRRAYESASVQRLLSGAGLTRVEVTAEFPLHPVDGYLHVLARVGRRGVAARVRRALARVMVRVVRHAVDPDTVLAQSWLGVGWKAAGGAGNPPRRGSS